jgi:hypothetical protein
MDLHDCCWFGSLYYCFTRTITDISVYNRTTRHIIVLDDIYIGSIGNGIPICDIEGCVKSEGKPCYRYYFYYSERLPSIRLPSCELISTPIIACSFNSCGYNINRLVCMEMAQKVSIRR